jgi:hypothetical protein
MTAIRESAGIAADEAAGAAGHDGEEGLGKVLSRLGGGRRGHRCGS